MYHAIVRRNLRRTFDHLNAHDYGRVVQLFTPDHVHSFPGAHPLAGMRRTLEATRAWYGRLARVLPDLQFEIRSIAVSGWPWHTTAAVEWTDRGTTADGKPFTNQGVHVVTLRWGKVSSLQIYCDTAVLSEVCARQAANGIAEASAAPIES